jgi:hypothetical protein
VTPAILRRGSPPRRGASPISDGNLIVTRDGAAVIVDADRNRILRVDLASQGILGEAALHGADCCWWERERRLPHVGDVFLLAALAALIAWWIR